MACYVSTVITIAQGLITPKLNPTGKAISAKVNAVSVDTHKKIIMLKAMMPNGSKKCGPSFGIRSLFVACIEKIDPMPNKNRIYPKFFFDSPISSIFQGMKTNQFPIINMQMIMANLDMKMVGISFLIKGFDIIFDLFGRLNLTLKKAILKGWAVIPEGDKSIHIIL